MSLRESLLREIEQYCKRTGTPETVFGRYVLNDTALVSSIRAGRSPGSDTIDIIRGYIRAHEPKKRRRR